MASSKLSGLTAFWQEFSLRESQSKLDDMATEITARQDESEESRSGGIRRNRTFARLVISVPPCFLLFSGST